jgi:HTH-type transcriptional regulator/antitoxin HigA
MKPIKTEQDYQNALDRLSEVFDAPVNSPEGDEAEVLAVLIEHYEDTHYPIDPPDPIDAIKIRMEEMGLKQKDLVGIIGTKSRVSEVLNKKKKLTVEMIRHLERELKLSASILIANY